MGSENLWLVVSLVLIIPLFFWLRVKAYNIRKKSVMVGCPLCGHNQRLRELKNYECQKCKEEVAFYNEDGSPNQTVEYYQCMACGAQNFKGVITCTACGLANPHSV